jgi:hypothetical protein
LFTQFGFFSVVCKGGKMQVRARNRAHLVALVKRCEQLQGTEKWVIFSTPKNDYGWRIEITRAQWVAVAALLAEEIDWGNFKDRCAKSGVDSRYVRVLHRVWEKMFDYQSGVRFTAGVR